MSGSMRAQLPECAAIADALRDAFGREEIDNVIRRGLRPDCDPAHRVYFCEAGTTLGTPAPVPLQAVSGDAMVLESVREAPVRSGKGRR